MLRFNPANCRQCESVHERTMLGTGTACCVLLAGTFLAISSRLKSWKEIKIHNLLFLKRQGVWE